MLLLILSVVSTSLCLHHKTMLDMRKVFASVQENPSQNLFTLRGYEIPNSEVSNFCTAIVSRHPPRFPRAPCLIGVENSKHKTFRRNPRKFFYQQPDKDHHHLFECAFTAQLVFSF